MESHDPRSVMSGLRPLRITRETSEEEAMSAMRMVAPFNQCMLGIARFAGQTPWERHPDGDELLHILEGEVELTLLSDGSQTAATARAGSIVVVPRGLWHRQQAPDGATLFFATPAQGTEASWADDPRRRD